MVKDDRFADIDWKTSTSVDDPFPDLFIKDVKEIINTGGVIPPKYATVCGDCTRHGITFVDTLFCFVSGLTMVASTWHQQSSMKWRPRQQLVTVNTCCLMFAT